MPASEPVDDPLGRFRAGDPAAFDELVTLYAGRLVRFFFRLGASQAVAEELAQDVFVKLYRGAASYEPRGRFDPFLFRVARNAWLDHLRSRESEARARSFDAGEAAEGAPDIGPDPSERARDREEAEGVRKAVSALPEGERLVVELGVFQGLRYVEIASILKIPVGTVKSRVFSAVRRLRGQLGGLGT